MSEYFQQGILLWDFENQRIPKNTSVQDVWNKIRDALYEEGVMIRNAYVYLSENTVKAGVYSELKNCGLKLRLCVPTSLQKKVQADQEILSDLLDMAEYAENLERNIVMITSDGDFAHQLNVLRNRGIITTLVYNASSPSSLNARLASAVSLVVPVHFDLPKRNDNVSHPQT